MFEYYAGETIQKPKMRTRDVCCILFTGVVIFALGVVGGIFIGIYAYHGGPDGNEPNVNVECISASQRDDMKPNQTTVAPSYTTKTTTRPPTECELKACPKRKAETVSLSPEIFAPLTDAEMASVRDFMVKEGIVDDKIEGDLTVDSNYVISMDSFAPIKTNVVRYLDRNGQFPGRYAKVIVNRGARDPPDVMTYQVGPLGSTAMTSEKMATDGDVAFEARPIDNVEMSIYYEMLGPVGAVLKPLLQDSFDGGYLGDGRLSWWPYGSGPPGPLEKEREAKVHLYISPLDEYGDMNLLDYLPLSCVIHCPGKNRTTWKVHNFFYLNQGPYATAQDLVDAYNSGALRKVKLPSGYMDTATERMYVGRDDSQPFRANAHMPPPRTYEPMGPRYTIAGHHVQWMGWSFDVTSKMMRGGAIFDIRYKNTRIAYELALNEITLIYGSDSHGRANVVYTDSTYGIGFYSGVLRGIDCPEHASLIETSYYNAYTGKGETHKSICVFEADAEAAAWRHKYTSYQGGLRQTYLVIRYSSTVVNYDYIVDYEFHLDGKIYTKIKATGFIQTDFWDAANPNRDKTRDSGDARDAFGFRVTDNGHGAIHDHIYGFKVDLDVIDSNNSFEVIHFKAGETVDAFKSQNDAINVKPEYFEYNQTRYIEYETVQTERGYRLDLEDPKLWTIVNENYRNRWGVKRGYQLLPLSTSLQTMVDTHPAMNTISFSKNTCTATKYKDSEPALTSIFDLFRFDNAMGDLAKYIDGENIVNEDIVNWMAVGFVHVPTSEDVPMTVAVETGFMLKPFNFFDETDIFDMPSFYNSIDGDKQKPPEVEPCLENDPNM